MDDIARYNKERWEELAKANVIFSRPWLDLDKKTGTATDIRCTFLTLTVPKSSIGTLIGTSTQKRVKRGKSKGPRAKEAAEERAPHSALNYRPPAPEATIPLTLT
jgi:hypothetical protein